MAEEMPYHRIWNDSAEGVKISDADPVAHSPEALKVLKEQGVDAWRQWVAEKKRSKKSRDTLNFD